MNRHTMHMNRHAIYRRHTTTYMVARAFVRFLLCLAATAVLLYVMASIEYITGR